jgi:hypothetical protein
MLGSKSSENSSRVLDTFTCLRCETVMTFGPSPDTQKQGGRD